MRRLARKVLKIRRSAFWGYTRYIWFAYYQLSCLCVRFLKVCLAMWVLFYTLLTTS